MKGTADTITDEQIRELRDGLAFDEHGPWSNERYWIIRAACHALGEGLWYCGTDARIPPGYEAAYMREGRARCAEAWNARHGGES